MGGCLAGGTFVGGDGGSFGGGCFEGGSLFGGGLEGGALGGGCFGAPFLVGGDWMDSGSQYSSSMMGSSEKSNGYQYFY